MISISEYNYTTITRSHALTKRGNLNSYFKTDLGILINEKKTTYTVEQFNFNATQRSSAQQHSTDIQTVTHTNFHNVREKIEK
jgi:hypothetical protein